jgi:mono/diheme cytochrome c family protein
MTYPVWDPGFAHGLLMAFVAILHVFVSHFAVGGGLFLVVTEVRARRLGDDALLDWLHVHARFFILLTLVFGAITGVGIWFTIGLVNPIGTSALIHAFVWGWAIEWVFFFVEISAALVYYYGWHRMTARAHLAVGWIYFGAAWLSMVIINGILSFQLTPGRWLETREFWDGFFNPTYFSSLAARTGFALALAGLFVLVTASRAAGETARRRIVRLGGIWALVGLVAAALGSRWWWSDVPLPIRELAAGGMSTATAVSGPIVPLLGLLALLVVVGPLLAPRFVRAPAAAVLLAAALVLMGLGEWLREAVRKPWIVVDYLYVNGVLADEVDALRETGIVARSPWIDDDPAIPLEAHGAAIVRIACRNCHARDGYNGLAPAVAGWDAEFAAAMVRRVEYLREPMPPWVGTDEEAEAAGAWLAGLAGPARAGDTGAEIFARRCGPCHTVDGFRSMREIVEGWSAEELDEVLLDLETDEMPPFTGTDDERALLAEWLEGVGASPPPDVGGA